MSSWNHSSWSNLFSKPPLWSHSPTLHPGSPALQVHETWQSTQKCKQLGSGTYYNLWFMGFEYKGEKLSSKHQILIFYFQSMSWYLHLRSLEQGTNYGLICLLTWTFECFNHLWPICACVIYNKSAYLKGQEETSCHVSTNSTLDPYNDDILKKELKSQPNDTNKVSVVIQAATLHLQQRCCAMSV